MEMIRSDISAFLAWFMFIPTVLVNVVVNMSQMSALVEGLYGTMGMLPPTASESGVGFVLVTLGATVLGGYKRVEKVMTALLIVILISFLIVAIT